ncbi:crotonase [Mesorhizobium loti]|uniref:Crotonase n=1 Tax=Rhizobium loti TaxID=381 RepID=A0A101KNX4_RHILI|nr:crotonase [Mesorhizobium loti]
MSQGPGTVEVIRDGDVAVIYLRRNWKRNALSIHMETELARVLRSDAVKTSLAVVITGGEGAFSAGADITELREMTAHSVADYYRNSGAVYEMLADLRQPTVAAIAGYCLGGGLELALAADIRVADPSAVFGLPEVGLGILASAGGVSRMVRVVGAGRARDLILRGRRIDVRQAENWGIVTEVSAPGEHVDLAKSIAHELARHPSLAVSINKQILDVSFNAPRDATLLMERLAYAVLAPIRNEG